MLRMGEQSRSAAASVHTTSPTLVGRDGELRTATDVVTTPPAVLLLEGEAGVGKSRVVRELLAEPAVAARQVLSSSCQPLREPFPFGPVLDALRTIAPADRSGLNPVTGVLRPLLPELGDRLPEAPGNLGDTAAERHRLFRAVRSLLSAAGPAVLVVEDLHWSDAGSRELLRFLVTDPPPNLSTVLTYRREDLGGGVPLGSAYRHPPNVTSAVIRLDPLGPEHVAELVARLLDRNPVSPEFAAKLHEQTAGIPFVVEETLHALRDPAGALRADGQTAQRLFADLDVPVLLREAMSERLADLPEDAARLVRAASVLGVAATADVLGAVAGVDECDDGLVDALHSNVLRESGSQCYGFRQGLARQAVYDTLTGPERRILHTRALHHLARTEPAPLMQLAEHSIAAGRTTDWLRYGEQAADRAALVGDAATATGMLPTLLAEASLSPEDVERLAIKFSTAALGGVAQRDVSAALGRVLTDPRLSETTRGEVRLNLGLLLLRQTDALDAARAELEVAIEELSSCPARAAVGMAALAQAHVGTTPIGENLRWIRRVEAVVAGSHSSELIAELLGNVLPAQLHIGGPVTTWQYFDKLPRRPASTTEQRHLARIHANIADADAWLGHYSRAYGYLSSARRLARDSGGRPYLFSTLLGTETRLDLLTGRWDDLAERASALLEDFIDLRPVAVELSLVLGWLAMARGHLDEAEERLRSTGVDAPDESFAPVVIAARAALARLRLSEGDAVRALQEVAHGLSVVRRKNVWVWAADFVPVAVDVYREHDRLRDADAVVDEFATGIAERDALVTAPALAAGRAALHEALGELDGAIQWWNTASAGYESLPQPYSASLAAERAALCRLRLADEGATAALSEIVARFERLGASRDASRCRHALRSTGTILPSPRGRRGYGSELSPREAEVARLLGRGCTNRDIASALFLSPRTVEQHVAKVLRKLGARTRGDLVRQ